MLTWLPLRLLFFQTIGFEVACRGFSFFSSVVMVSCCCWCQLYWTCRCTVSPWLRELLVVLYCNWKFCDILGSNVRSVLAMPILSQMPEAINQCSLGICSEPISRWGATHLFLFFVYVKLQPVFLPFSFWTLLFPFFERRSPLFHLRWHDSFADKTVRIHILAQTIFSGYHIFCAVLCAK